MLKGEIENYKITKLIEDPILVPDKSWKSTVALFWQLLIAYINIFT